MSIINFCAFVVIVQSNVTDKKFLFTLFKNKLTLNDAVRKCRLLPNGDIAMIKDKHIAQEVEKRFLSTNGKHYSCILFLTIRLNLLDNLSLTGLKKNYYILSLLCINL